MTEKPSGLLIKMPQMDGDIEKFVIGDIDMENSVAHKDISVINIRDINQTINSNDIISRWKQYRINAARRIYKSEGVMYVKFLKERNTESTFIDFVSKYGFPVFTKNEEIIDHLMKKKQRFRDIINGYKKLINSKNSPISKTQFQALEKELKSEVLSDKWRKIYSKLMSEKNVWDRPWGCDFTKYGGGLVFVNKNENIWDWVNLGPTVYNQALVHDVVVYCHGTDVTPAHHLNENELKLAEKISTYMSDNKVSSSEALRNFQDSLTSEERQIIAKYGKDKLVRYYKVQTSELDRYCYSMLSYIRDRIRGDLKKNWGFGSLLKTPYGSFRDVNELIRECVRRGHKKIKIMCCNPGHYYIAPDIQKLEDVEVDYQIYSVLVENSNQ